VVEARDVGLDLRDRRVGIGRHDPPLRDLLDRQLVGEALHLDGGVDAVLLLGGERSGAQKTASTPRRIPV
jgi:hypothetical protein